MLDDAPVKIDDIERSIGSRGHAYRTEALIRGREKLTLTVGFTRHEPAFFEGDNVSLHEMQSRLAGEGIAKSIRREEISPVNPG